MSLRDINHQAAIELGELDTEYHTALKDEFDRLLQKLKTMPRTRGMREKRASIRNRLARIEELLA